MNPRRHSHSYSEHLAELRAQDKGPKTTQFHGAIGTLAGLLFWFVAFAGLTAIGLYVGSSPSSCGSYINSNGVSVSRPCGNWFTRTAPSGATARCRDGSFSFSHHPHADGTCSHHWGVASYL